MIKRKLIFVFFLFAVSLFANTNFQLEEEVKKVNEEIFKLKNELKEKMNKVDGLYKKSAPDIEYKTLLDEIKKIKQNIHALEENFRKDVVDDSIKTDEGYAFWDQGETTISQLVMEYGSQDYLYIIPQELSSIKLNMFSTIAIPRQSWNELMEFILNHNGIGIKKINPFLRELYVLKQDPSYIDAIISKPQDLNRLEEGSIICYIFSPPVDQLRSVQSFLERFCDIKQTTIHAIKTNIIVVGSKETIDRLINLYDAVFKNADGKIIKVISLSKINPLEADKILQAFFSQTQRSKPSFFQGSIEDLTILTQDSSLILIGEASLVEKAQEVLIDLEKQLDDPSEMTIFWYTCKNSDPQDLADILEKIYIPMTGVKIEEKQKNEPLEKPKSIDTTKYNSNLPVKPKFFEPGKIYPIKESQSSSSNFVVDAKTGSLLMVVRKDELEKLKTLLKKLDEPKKMVQIDVLLIERKIQDRKQTGINLLKIGNASNKKETGFDFDSGFSSKRKGILDFIISRPKSSKIPAFDLILSFLMVQDNMRISDCPSILAVNQTPATISVVDEISINNGAVQIDTSSGPRYEKSFTRAQFGTTIVMTPIIHFSDEENSDGFVTLHTDVSFDTTKSKDNDKPDVTRRHIENEVRVADGETIILGGLRRKTAEAGSEKIPFLGELPGIGKLFGTTKEATSSSEMFIFITPHIIKDPKLDFEKQRKYSLQKRQGDTEEFEQKLDDAKIQEKQKLFEESIKLIF